MGPTSFLLAAKHDVCLAMPRALVTGAGRGIGRQIARLFADKGYEVVALDVDIGTRDNKDEGDGALERVSYDLRNVGGITDLVRSLGELHVLVNNAGTLRCPDSASSLSAGLGLGFEPSDVSDILATNLLAPVALAEAVAPQMVQRGGGRIVNVGSISAFTGHPDLWYGASKAALLNATKSLASLLGAQGVMVNAVVPGPTQTTMYEELPQSRKDTVMRSVHSGRPASPAEVAAAVCWLGTEAPAYINGATIDVCDGAYPR